MTLRIEGSKDTPILNPAFVIKHWNRDAFARVDLKGAALEAASDLKQGIVWDTDGTRSLVIYMKFESDNPVEFTVQ